MESREPFPAKSVRVQRFGVCATAVFAAFLAGFVPMWLMASTRANERDAAQQALRVTQIENTLASATIQAGRGAYEPAYTAASAFYMRLQAEIARSDSGFDMSLRDGVQTLLAERDQMMMLLARRDPTASERLANTYISYRRRASALPRQAPDDGGR